MQVEEIRSLIEDAIPGAIIEIQENASPKKLVVSTSSLIAVCEFIHAHEKLYFDSLSCITGMDNGPEENQMEVIYGLYSIPHHISLSLQVNISRKDPMVPSVTSIWKAANWHEREAYDLLGIHFEGHPDLRRILLPEDWTGHPLRKDYEEQENYHGVKVKY
ncbi:MAG: NADH-quinone oxidoreductase subunit C [Ekhidna sp.]